MAAPRRNPSVAWSRAGDSIFILELQGSRKIHRLSPVASEIWELSDGIRTEEKISVELARMTESDPNTLEKDVQEFILELTEKNIFLNSKPLELKQTPHELTPNKADILFNELEQSAFRNNIPLFTTFELTLKCNLRCVHCYNFDRSVPMPKEIKDKELTPPDILRIIEELAQAGALIIAFSGGEALLHPHLLDFVRHARKHHMGVKVKSNATLLTNERALALAQAGATEMDISLYGASAASHDAFTTVSGSFERTLRGIRAARDSGLHPSISFIIHRGNFREVAEMKKLAKNLQVPHALSTELTARYDGTTDSRDHRLTRDELEELITGPASELFSDLYNPADNVQCACARMVCGINSVGDVYPCIGAPLFSGNLKSASFSEIWNDSSELKKIRGLKLDDFKTCKPCSHRKYCQRSSGSVYVDTGNYTGPEPWTCMQAELVHEHHSKV